MNGVPPYLVKTLLLLILLCSQSIPVNILHGAESIFENYAGTTVFRNYDIQNIMAYEGDEDHVIDLEAVFEEAADDIQGFEVMVNSKPWVASAHVTDQLLTIGFHENGQTTIVVQANTAGDPLTTSFVVGVMPLIEGDYVISDFRNLTLGLESYWNGSDGSGGFNSGLAFFPNHYNPEWFSWSGWAYSNITDNTTPGFMNQYSAITGSGLDTIGPQSGKYAISYVSGQGSVIQFDNSSAHEVKGFFVTNSTYAALSMMHGDAYAKQFGGPSGNDPDWFKLYVSGYRNNQLTDTVEFYLADYRFSDNTENYIIQTWQWVELSELGKVDSLLFWLNSTDVGDWGMNTPAYFALDMLHVVPDQPPYVANPLQNIYLTANSPDQSIDISTVFSDPDDDDAAITITIKENTNPDLLQAWISKNYVMISLHPDKTGYAHITLEALSNGKTVTDAFTVFCSPDSEEEQFIYEVLEYIPAPGQFINKEPWGMPASAESIVGGINGGLSLGAFGGYVVFRFEDAVINHPDHPFGVDFIIFGNPLPHWSEPGSVWVMKDENGNAQPDGTWYQLAGSDYHFSTTLHDYELTYVNPGSDVAVDVPWFDNYGNSGHIKVHDGHTQPYYPMHEYFPDIDPVEYSMTGTRIADAVDMTNPAMVQSHRRAFGYADNTIRGTAPFNVPDNPFTPEVEHAGGDGFDISWAVDEYGEYVELDMIHFIKVQTAVLANAGWMGEVSTEITGAVKTRPAAEIAGVLDMIVIRDVPHEITEPTYQLEAYAFHRGRLQPDAIITWQTDLDGAYVDENMVLHLEQNGELTLTASLLSNPDIQAQTETLVNLPDDPTSLAETMAADPVIYPNPARDHLFIDASAVLDLEVYDLSGVRVLALTGHEPGSIIDVSDLPRGLYIVKIVMDERVYRLRMIKGKYY